MSLDGDSPTARALRALAAIQDHPGLTAADLGERLGVTDRAARRYVRILRDAGIPVESSQGRWGGYQIGRGFRPPPLTFTISEALGLTMAAVESHHGRDDAAGRALTKLTRVLPSGLAAAVDAVRASATAAPPAGATDPADPAVVAHLAEAITARRRTRLRYRARSSFVTEVDPWAVVPRRGLWYLLCWSHDRGARRLYRVDRVSEVRPLDDTFVYPDDLDPVAAVEEHLSEGWELAVEVVIDAPVERVRWWVPRQLGRLEPTDDGGTRLLGSTSTPDWYAVKLAEIAAPFRVVSPPELAVELRGIAARLREAAQSDSRGGSVG